MEPKLEQTGCGGGACSGSRVRVGVRVRGREIQWTHGQGGVTVGIVGLARS